MIECPVCESRLVETKYGSSVEIKCTKCDYSVVTTNISLIYEDETIYDVYLLSGNIGNQKVFTLVKNILIISSSEVLNLINSGEEIKLYSGSAVEVKSIREKLDNLNLSYKITPEYNW